MEIFAWLLNGYPRDTNFEGDGNGLAINELRAKLHHDILHERIGMDSDRGLRNC